MGRPLISVRDLTLQFDTDEGRITAVNRVSFDIAQGEVMGLVGESGSGKSVTAKSLMQLNARNAVYGPDSRIILNLEDREIDVLALKSPADLLVDLALPLGKKAQLKDMILRVNLRELLGILPGLRDRQLLRSLRSGVRPAFIAAPW